MSHGALAELIRGRLHEIMALWEPCARRLPTAAELSRPVLLDDLPLLLHRIAEHLERGGPAAPPPSEGDDLSLAISEHALQRAEIGAGLSQVIAELLALRDTVERLWEESAQADSEQALSALREAFDWTILASAERFSHLRIKLLEAVDRIAQGACGQNLEDVLESILQTFLASLDGVHTAAILLREEDVLRTRAAVGLEEEVSMGFSLQVGEGFAGLVAAKGEPHLLRSAATDPLVKSPVLRRSGIKALYGVPMRMGDEASPILGVAHIGSKNATGFAEETKALFRVLVARAAGVLRQAYALEQLELERARYAAVVEGSPAIIFSKDIEGRYLTISRRALEPLGLAPEAIIGRTDRDVFPEQVARELLASDRRVLETRAAVEDEEVIPGPGGPHRYLTIKFPILDPQRRLIAIAGVATDVTERRRWTSGLKLLAEAGAALASSLDYEKTLAEVARLAVPALADCCVLDVVDDDGTIRRMQVVHASPDKAALADELRTTPLDRSQPHLVGTVLEEHRPMLMTEVPASFLETIAQSERHLELLRELRPTSMIQVPLLARGRLLGAWVFMRSATSRRYDAVDLEIVSELQRRASLAIDNARLYGAAQRAVEARDEVLAVIAHDLRNPLATLVSSARSLGAQLAPGADRERRAVGRMTRAAKQMSRLINQLLDEHALEAGRLSVEPGPCSASEIVRQAAEMSAPHVEAASLALDVSSPPDLPPVGADADRIQQVFDNLIGNAIKFTPPGGRIRIGASAAEEGVTFFVRNSGDGIPAEDLPHVFDRYWKARRADRRGVGLGLAICKEIVEAHGGEIWVDSSPGQGASFSFTIPCAPPR